MTEGEKYQAETMVDLLERLSDVVDRLAGSGFTEAAAAVSDVVIVVCGRLSASVIGTG